MRPEGFDLRAAWQGVVQHVEADRRQVRALVRVPEAALEPLGMQFGADLEVVEQPAGGRALVAISAPWPNRIAEQLAGWGALLEVVEPEAVRTELARIARELAERYGLSPA